MGNGQGAPGGQASALLDLAYERVEQAATPMRHTDGGHEGDGEEGNDRRGDHLAGGGSSDRCVLADQGHEREQVHPGTLAVC